MDASKTHLVLIFLLLLVAFNLFILDIRVFTPPFKSVKISDISTSSLPTPTLTPSIQPTTHPTPPDGLRGAGNTFSPRSFSEVGQPIREIFIPLGSGGTEKNEWQDIYGTDTLIDFSRYPQKSSTRMTVTLKNQTQNGSISVRLLNVTDKYIVWNTEMTMSGPVVQTLTSPPITLEPSEKLYRIQMKSSLQYPAILENAKIRVIY